MNMKRAAISVVAILLCLAMVACTQTQIISDIDVALTAASIALPIVASAVGLPPAVTTQIIGWIQLSLKGLTAVTGTLEKGGPAPQVAAEITAELSGIVASVPDLQGLPASIASVVQALATDVQGILTQYGTNALTSASAGRSDALGGNNIHFGTHDRQRLVALRAKAMGILADSEVRMQMLKK
jgi:hypothetical protein